MIGGEHLETAPEAFDATTASASTLRNRGISFAVDGIGKVLRYPDGTPINGQQIEDTVNRSGRRLTNAQAAGHIVSTQQFVDDVKARLAELRSNEPSPQEVVDPNLT